MNDSTPKIYVIAGPNGSGKTTSTKTLLPDLLQCHEYVNADSVAAALSPFRPETVAIQAGRLMLERIQYLADQGVDFAFETTLSSRMFIQFLNESKTKAYEINILFLWLSSPDIAIQRVKTRVEEGGHDIPEDIVRRRYRRSIDNFFESYKQLATNWFLYDNSKREAKLIAKEIGRAHADLAKRIDYGVKRAVRDAVLKHKNLEPEEVPL